MDGRGRDLRPGNNDGKGRFAAGLLSRRPRSCPWVCARRVSARRRGVRARFCHRCHAILSFFYPRTKGKTEADIRSLGFASLTILRPIIIEGERGESRLGESIVLKLAEVLAPILPRGLRANPASTIARVLIDAVVASKQGVRFVFSQDLTAKS